MSNFLIRATSVAVFGALCVATAASQAAPPRIGVVAPQERPLIQTVLDPGSLLYKLCLLKQTVPDRIGRGNAGFAVDRTLCLVTALPAL